jgi:hypothetical protein
MLCLDRRLRKLEARAPQRASGPLVPLPESCHALWLAIGGDITRLTLGQLVWLEAEIRGISA